MQNFTIDFVYVYLYNNPSRIGRVSNRLVLEKKKLNFKYHLSDRGQFSARSIFFQFYRDKTLVLKKINI